MFSRMHKNEARRRELREIEALDDRDLTDIGLDRAALLHLAETDPAVFARMDRMAEVHGLTHEDLQVDRPDFAALARACEDCRAKGQCDHMLATPGVRAADTGFCPNHDAYLMMAAGK